MAQKVQVPLWKTEVVDYGRGLGIVFNAGVLAKMSELGQFAQRRPRDASTALEGASKNIGLWRRRSPQVTVSRVAGANQPWIEEMRQGPQWTSRAAQVSGVAIKQFRPAHRRRQEICRQSTVAAFCAKAQRFAVRRNLSLY